MLVLLSLFSPAHSLTLASLVQIVSLIVLTTVVFLVSVRRNERKERRAYAMVVFISNENRKKEVVIRREGLMDGGDSSDSETEGPQATDEPADEMLSMGDSGQFVEGIENSLREGGGSMRAKKKKHHHHQHFSREVFIRSLDVNIVEEVGRGSFGVVYMATWHDTLVCVKHLADANANDDAENKVRMRRE